MNKRAAREVAFKTLYEVDVGRMTPAEALADVMERDKPGEDEARFASDLVAGTLEHLADVDRAIASFAVGWALDRMPSVDRNIMRIAAYEVLFRPDIPSGASVNEAVELAKKYGDEDSSRFVNGVLGRIVREYVLP